MKAIASAVLAGALGLAFVQGAAAQQNDKPQGTRLITLGTRGGPLPTKDRTQSANLLVVNGALYLIDAGDNVTRRIVQSGNDFRKVGKIFITHPHSDHTAGLATLMVSQWEYQRAEPVDIYGGGDIIMTHFGPSVRPNDDYQRFADEAKQYFSGNIVLAKDLMEF